LQMLVWRSDIAGGAEAWRGPNRWHLWILAATGFVGLAVMLFSLLLARGEENANRTLRVLLYGYNAVLTGILLLVVLIVANVLAYNTLPETSDWTASGIYTLDSKSENVLKGLTQPVTIYVIEENRNLLASREIHELMDNIRSVNSKVQVEYLLRDQNLEPVGELMQKYKLADDTGVLILYGSRDRELHQFLRIPELFTSSPPPDMMHPDAPRPAPKFRGEDAVMSAIEFMEMDQKKPVVYFVQGNGCLDLFGLDREATPDHTARALADRLRDDHYDVKGWVLSDTALPDASADVTTGMNAPDDAALVVILGPREKFNDKQVETLRHFMSVRYRLNEPSLGALRIAGVSEPVLDKLKGLIGKEFAPEGFPPEVAKAVEPVSDENERTKQEALIFKHARRQGKMMVLLDAVAEKSNPRAIGSFGLQSLLAEYNVEIPPERVLRFDPRGQPPPDFVLVTTNAELRGKNPLATAFEGKALPLSDLRVVRAKQSGGMGNPGEQHQADVLLHTVHPFDQINPPCLVVSTPDLGDATELIRSRAAELRTKAVAVLPVGVAVSDSNDPHAAFMRGRSGGADSVPRMVVIGSAEANSDAEITSPRGRTRERERDVGTMYYDLFSSALAWLNEKPASIGVTKKDRGIYKMDAKADLGSMRLTPFLLMSIAVIGVGLGVWVVRRR
jgi:hypothetical protein